VDSNKDAGRLLGTMLLEQGALSENDMKDALAVQVEGGKRIGEILLESELISRPLLARALAEQSGVQLVEEPGFGSGLRAVIEQRHQEKKERARARQPARTPEHTSGADAAASPAGSA
jgi:hypothetical protein